MSSVYATEPATSGRVIFETTHGPIEIQLWCRECPETTRIFLQLCLDGFYDNMIFHRILPNCFIQTGALRQPAVLEDEESIRNNEEYRSKIQADQALERRQYEVHSRLKFNHRGQVAMALTVQGDEGQLEEIQPQFFITLEDTPFLDGKHVLFGTVSGPTVFNAIRIGKVDVDEETNQPKGDLEYAPRIKSVKIVDNPLHSNLTSQPKVPWRAESKPKEKKKKKRKGKRDINVLSFGDEMEQDDGDEGLPAMKSSHDVLQSRKLSKAVDESVKEAVENASADVDRTEKPATRKEKSPRIYPTEEEDPNAKSEEQPDVQEASEELHSEEERKIKYLAKRSEAPLQNDLAKSSETAQLQDAPKAEGGKRDSAMSMVEARRAKYVKGRKNKTEREDETLAKLSAFQNKVRGGVGKAKESKRRDDKDNSLASRMAERAHAATNARADQNDGGPAYHGQVLESDGDEEGSSNWIQTEFMCRRHMDHQSREGLGGDGRDMDDYEVVDDKGHRNPQSGGHSRKRHKDNRHERDRRHKHHGDKK
jgi:peptidyl-prolyl cis-trans isomerase SDCCAG10